MKHIEIAKKLKALADKGVGGEKQNAATMLDALMKKHNISIEDIEGEAQHDYFFTLKGDEDILWSQIVAKVNYKIKKYGQFPAKKVKDLGLKGNFMITCTPSEYIEIEAMQNIYQRLYKQELKIFYHAFCHANDLLVDGPKQLTYEDLTPEEIEQIKRVKEMSKKIKSETFRKQLT